MAMLWRSMTNHPTIQLSRLREIGWTLWDPIGLADENGSYGDGCADEYDGHLLHVVSLIRHGRSNGEAVTYLTSTAADHMGLTAVDTDAAAATVHAIADYLSTLSDGPKTRR